MARPARFIPLNRSVIKKDPTEPRSFIYTLISRKRYLPSHATVRSLVESSSKKWQLALHSFEFHHWSCSLQSLMAMISHLHQSPHPSWARHLIFFLLIVPVCPNFPQTLLACLLLILFLIIRFGDGLAFFSFFAGKRTPFHENLVIVSKRISGLEEAMRIRRYCRLTGFKAL